MAKIENIRDSLDRYLRNKGLPKITGFADDISELFEIALRSVWTHPDEEKREELAVEIAQAIKPYFGGKKIEDALDDIRERLNRELAEKAKRAKVADDANEVLEIKQRMQNPDYVPTFEELIRVKKKDDGK